MDALSAGGEAQDQREFSKARQPKAASPGGTFPHIDQRAQLERTESTALREQAMDATADKVFRIRMLTLPHDIVVPIE